MLVRLILLILFIFSLIFGIVLFGVGLPASAQNSDTVVINFDDIPEDTPATEANPLFVPGAQLSGSVAGWSVRTKPYVVQMNPDCSGARNVSPLTSN